MQMYGISVPVIDGDTKNRQAVVRTFNETPGFGIMILSPKAAGVGLTITSANHVVHYTRWWNPAVENQATDRAYRIGQEKDVYVYQIITTDSKNFPQGTVEEIMHKLLEEKRALAENIIVPFNTKEIQQMVAEKMGMGQMVQ
jgi:SNF2 family DNA or RNA helicase